MFGLSSSSSCLLLNFVFVFRGLLAFERPVSVVFDGNSPSAVCGASYTGYSFQLSVSCLKPSPQSTIRTGAGLVLGGPLDVIDSVNNNNNNRNEQQQQLPRSACSANFVTPWQPTLPKMLFIVKLNRLRVPAGSRLRIISVNSFGSPTGDPEVDVRSGNLDSFRDKHGSDYVETTGTIRIHWESTNPVIDWATACVPYALDFELSIMAYWPRWVNRTSGAYECPMGSFLCRRINYCLPKQFVGDGVNHCVDGDDELGVFPHSADTAYPDTAEPPPFPSSNFPAPGGHPGSGALGGFNSAIFVPLIIFVILCVFLAACIVRSRAACRQLALRQATFSEACRQIFCGFRSSIRLSVRPTDPVHYPPTIRGGVRNMMMPVGPPGTEINGVGGSSFSPGGTFGPDLRGSNYSSSSGFRRWQEQFLRTNPSPAASVNIIPKEFDMSPPSYEEALKLPTANARSIREWFGHVKLSEIDVSTTTDENNNNNNNPVTSPAPNNWQPLTTDQSIDQSRTSVISLSSTNLSPQPQINRPLSAAPENQLPPPPPVPETGANVQEALVENIENNNKQSDPLPEERPQSKALLTEQEPVEWV